MNNATVIKASYKQIATAQFTFYRPSEWEHYHTSAAL